MSTCIKYIPYTLAEIESNISRVYTSLIANSGVAQYEKVKNGTDEYVTGDTLASLRSELEMWEKLRNAKLIELGNCTGNKNYTSGQYGC